MNGVQLVVLALAVWRASSLLVQEEGPFEIFARFRYRIGVRYTKTNVAIGNNELAKLFTCVWCLSVWIGALAALAWWLAPGPVSLCALPFALSAGAILIDRLAGG